MAPLEPTILIGAGVLGLSTAHHLLTTHPQTPLLLLATELPTDPPTWSPNYASMWAGAHYRPITPTTPQQHDERALALATHATMRRLAREHPGSGVAVVPGVELLERPGAAERALRSGDVYAGAGDGFRVLAPAELPPGVPWGCAYETYCVDVANYCAWLLQRVRAMGAVVRRRRVRDVGDAFAAAAGEAGFEGAKAVVDCSGYGVGGDSKMYPIRGQTVLVRQQYWRTVTRQCADGRWAFLIPRPNNGGTIVGGTKDVGDWDGELREGTREMLLKSAVEFFPDFVADINDFDVVRDNVGRRPAREGGLHAEVELLLAGGGLYMGMVLVEEGTRSAGVLRSVWLGC